MRDVCTTAVTACALLAGALGLAAGPAAAERLPQAHALTGARIVPEPGQEIAAGTVVVRDGVIEAVGADAAVPADARVWELAGATVYAGLIEPYAVRPWPVTGPVDSPQGGHPNALIAPERDMTLHADDPEGDRRLRAAGYTAAVVVPEPGILRGRAVLINLGDGGVRQNLLRRDVAQAVALDVEAEKGYPSSLMGSVALLRQTLLDARWYAAAHDAYRRRPAQERPVFDASLAALADVARGRGRVVFASEDALGTLRAAALAAELGLDAAVVGSGEEYQRAVAVAATGLPLVLPVSFPAPPRAEEDDLTVGLVELRHWREAPANPARLLAAGATVAVTSHGLDEPRLLHARLARAIEHGLTREQALAAVTTTPAALFGVADRLGTLAPGKIANLVVVDGELFQEKTKVREVWIDGRRYEVEEPKKPGADPAATAPAALEVK